MIAARGVSVPAGELRLYQRLVASVRGIQSKANFGAAYTAVNGNMYSMISKHGVVGIRLPEAERASFLRKYDTTLYRADPKWPPNKEYVAVPRDLLEDTGTLKPYLECSYRYALSLRSQIAKPRTDKAKRKPAKGTTKKR